MQHLFNNQKKKKLFLNVKPFVRSFQRVPHPETELGSPRTAFIVASVLDLIIPEFVVTRNVTGL